MVTGRVLSQFNNSIDFQRNQFMPHILFMCDIHNMSHDPKTGAFTANFYDKDLQQSNI